LDVLVTEGGNDLLLVPGVPACVLFERRVKRLEERVLNGTEIEATVLPALTPHALKNYRAIGIADSSYRVNGLGRFRINLHRERGNPADAIRALCKFIRNLPNPLTRYEESDRKSTR